MGGNKKKSKDRVRKNAVRGSRGGGRADEGLRNDFRGGNFGGPAQGSGTQHNTFVHQYAPVPTAMAALPPLPPEFTGREEDLAFLLGLLDPAREDGPAVAVLAGLPGVGKTTLVHAVGHAAQDRGWFTGVLLVGLRGYDPVPAQPENVLDALLRSLGVSAEHIPPTATEREALYRSQLDARTRAGERLLVIADNAFSAEQVRPLLPTGRHGLLVTSRRSLSGLGRMRTLNLLQPEEAVALLDAALRNADADDSRVADDPEAAERVVLACGCLPLALQITAALLAADPGQPLAERADRLTRSGERLEGLDDGERSLRATFDQSLDRLSPQQADLFRLLSLNAGPDISTDAAMSLTDKSRLVTENLLGQLAVAHLVQRGPVRGRWQLHDLLRDYAAVQAEAHTGNSRPARRRYEQARARLVAYYVHTAEAADTHLPPSGTTTPSSRFDNRAQALEWLDTERANLIATAHAESPTVSATRLAFGLSRYLDWRRRLQDLVAIHSLALDACRAMGDRANEAGAWNNLGAALQGVRRFEEAITAHEKARDLHQEFGDTHGAASAWNNLGLALRGARRLEEAITAVERARDLHQKLGDTHGAAGAWNNLGLALQGVQRYEEAITAAERARDVYEELGDTHGAAGAWNNLGGALQGVRRFEEAITLHEKARDVYEELGDTQGAASAWNNLGGALQGIRHFEEAITAAESARDAYQELGDTQGTASAWNNLGAALQGMRRFEKALTAHERARDLYQELGHTQGMASAWNNLGGSLQEMRRFEEALTAHESARDLYQKLDDTQGVAGTWNSLGLALRGVRRFDESISAAENSRDLYEELGHTQGAAGAWNNLGLALRGARRFDEALTAAERARDLYEDLGDTHGAAIAWNNLGVALRKVQRFEEAAAAGERAAAMLTAEKDAFRTGEALGELALTLSEAGTPPTEVRTMWLRAASAYDEAKATEEAADARAHADETN
ncbi:ATP-binding protein [Streptomyces capoamus]|uniref:ATP-binding protein n=1 Tax=Streptomyces capoamus TaxID=68183 RepID=UPI0033921C8B